MQPGQDRERSEHLPEQIAAGSIVAERARLANGLEVVLLPSSELPVVVTLVDYAAGSRHEPAHLCGLAHLCEHLAFAGGVDGGASYPTLIAERGGTANAATTFDATRFVQWLPSSELATALWIEGRRMSAPAPPALAEALEHERRVLLQERRQRVDNRPYGRAFERLLHLLFAPDHPYQRPPAGLPETLAAIAFEDVERFFDERYAPDRAVLVIAGDLPPGVMDEVERYLGWLPPASGAEPAAELPVLTVERWQRVVEPVPRARVYLAWRIAGQGQPGWFAAPLVCNALAVGRNSPLRTQLIETMGVADQVEAHLVAMREASVLVLSAIASPDVEAGRLENALVGAVERLLGEIPAGALERARRRARADFYYRFQEPAQRAELCARLFGVLEPPACLTTEPERYAGLDETEIRGWADALRRSGDRAVLSIVPAGGAP